MGVDFVRVDLLGVDLVGVDFVRVDLLGGHLPYFSSRTSVFPLQRFFP